MTKKYSEGALALANAYMNKPVDKETLDASYEKIKELASIAEKKQSAREELAEIVGYTVDSVINQRMNYLELIADVKRVADGEKAEFKVKYDGIKAELIAKSATPAISRIAYKRVTVPTVEVAARPSIPFRQLAHNPEVIMEVIDDAAVKMENQMVGYVQSVLYTAYSALTETENFVQGAGVTTAGLDPQVRAMARFGGRAAVIGDISMTSQLAGLTGFDSRTSDNIIDEYNNNGLIGTYIGSSVVTLMNRYADDTSLDDSNLVLRNDLLYTLPVGTAAERPLKVVMEGDVRSAEQRNNEDETWELFLRMDFGVSVVGIQKLMAVYEDTNL